MLISFSVDSGGVRLQLAMRKLASAEAPADSTKCLARDRPEAAVLEAVLRLRAGVFFFLVVVIQAAILRCFSASKSIVKSICSTLCVAH